MMTNSMHQKLIRNLVIYPHDIGSNGGQKWDHNDDEEYYDVVNIRWNRKIFWILTNYTSYLEDINDQYMDVLCVITSTLL